MITRKQAYLKLSLILLIFFLLALAHSLWLPLHEAPDEVAHFLYSRFIARTGRLPLNYEERAEAGYLSFWPPLYHTVVATLAGWSDNDDSPHLKFVWQSPRFDMARELLDTKRLANTEDELWPYQGGVLMWHLGRVVSILLSMGTIWVTFMAALEIWPNNYRRAVLSAAMIAFVPTFIFISSAVSYESLVGLVTGLYFWVLVRIVKGDPRRRNYVLLGLLIGILVTVKYTAVILPVQVIGVFVFLAWKCGWGWSGWLKRVTLTALVSILASSWWFLFLTINFNETAELGPVIGILKPIIAGGIDVSQNYTAAILTGGQIGTTESLEILSDPFWAWLVRIYQTFWVREIDGFPLWPVAHILIGLACLSAVVGLVYLWRRQPDQRVWVGIFVSHILIFCVFPLLRFSVQGNVRWTAQGRHVLFPAATVLPLLITWGWQGWLSLKVRRHLALAVVGGLLCWSMVQLIRVIDYPLLYLPIRTTPKVSVQISHRLEQTFGEHLVLLGYDLETAPADSALKIKLYWQSSAYVDEDYLMNIALVQNDVPQFSWSTYPVNGRYPTRIWESWETIRDDIWLPLVDLPPGNYQLKLQLFGSEGVLPVGNKDALILDDIFVPIVVPIQPHILFSTSVEGREIVTGVTLWQAERYRKFDLPEYRPRMQIAFVWQGESASNERVVWLLVDPKGQVYPATQVLEHFGHFVVGLDWPSGKYRLRLERWREDTVIASQESKPIVTIVNEKPRLLKAPPVAYPLEANFANRIKLLGYDLPDRSLLSGQGIPITLYWQGLRTMGQSYTVFTKLFDHQQQLWGSVERLPADGYSTFYWLENEIVIDSFELPVNPNVPAGVYWLNVGLYEEIEGTAASLPIMFDGQPGDTSVTFGTVKIGGPPSDVVLSAREINPTTPLSIEFGTPPVILLHGYNLTQNNDHELRLTLYWESLAHTPIDWSIFAHLRDEAGETVAQKDGPAGSGRYPTSLWEAGEIVADEIVIPLTNLPDDDYRLFIGLYNFISGERLSGLNNPTGEVLLVENVQIKSSVSPSGK
jgi:hypothetical protein